MKALHVGAAASLPVEIGKPIISLVKVLSLKSTVVSRYTHLSIR